MNQNKKSIIDALIFVGMMWLFSRLIIVVVMLLIAPLLPAPSKGMAVTFGWQVFSAWDSGWYHQIATSGYEYVNDDKGHSVAFFPLFPLLSHVVMSIGIPFEIAGLLVNNLAFLGTIIIVYIWTNEHYGKSVAQWTIAVLTWFPLSIFTTVLYSESLYLFFSTVALRAFDQKQYVWTALSGAIATASRPTGVVLIPAFLLTAWQEKRGLKAYLASLATAGGLLLYSLYCQIKFGDALAFFHAQKAWRSSVGFDVQGWLKMLMQITVGSTNWKYGYIKDPWHPLLFICIVVSSYLLWHFRKKLGSLKVDYGFFAVVLIFWLLAGDPLINTITIIGGGYLLWYLRNQLTPITLIYGCCGLGLILASGGTLSLSRIAYGIISLSVSLGMILSRYPRWGYASVGFFMILLVTFSLRFAQKQWIG